MIDAQTALIHTMVLVSAADRDMTDPELQTIGEIVKFLPVFRDYDLEGLPKAAQDCAELLADEDGLDKALAEIKAALPEELGATAYALACDVAAADGTVGQEELRMLEWLRHGLNVSRLKSAAVEYAAKVRHATV